MRAVWSFWSKPVAARRNIAWCSSFHHLLAWCLSFHLAQRHYPNTFLVTDRAGRKLLVEQLGLPFVSVSTELDRLAEVDPGWWALGKLIAYGLQDQPFVHLDTDVFLWKSLPKVLVESPVFAQCPEYYSNGCKPSLPGIEEAFANEGRPLPLEWQWARSRGHSYFREENTGIFGGTHIEFIHHYANSALDLALRPENSLAWAQLCDKSSHNFTIEQFFLAACVDFHSAHAAQFGGVSVKYLFPSVGEACNINRASRAGYTHLWGATKSHPPVGNRLEERVRKEYPDYFRRCQKLAA